MELKHRVGGVRWGSASAFVRVATVEGSVYSDLNVENVLRWRVGLKHTTYAAAIAYHRAAGDIDPEPHTLYSVSNTWLILV